MFYIQSGYYRPGGNPIVNLCLDAQHNLIFFSIVKLDTVLFS